VTFREQLRAEPWSVDFFTALREFERTDLGKPRIGESTVVGEELVELGQDPYLEFPASNLSGYEEGPNGVPRLFSRFLGFFGPQGALPLNSTVEAYNWMAGRDPSFARFTDIFSNRFLQLFYRAWADAHPIVHHGRPRDDRFFRYVGALSGIGSNAFANRDAIEDTSKVGFSGLVASRVKSASRLRQLIRGVLGVDAEIEERIGSWLTFEPSDRLALGQAGSTLGGDAFVGGRVYSICDKIRVKIRASSLDQYLRFLPKGDLSDKLADLIFFYIGFRFEFDVQLSIPARYAPPARLGVSGQLGWTAWMAPKADADDKLVFDDARFDPMEQRRVARAEEQRRKGRKGGKS
jgi:type VI secretion system protein ImpH